MSINHNYSKDSGSDISTSSRSRTSRSRSSNYSSDSGITAKSMDIHTIDAEQCKCYDENHYCDCYYGNNNRNRDLQKIFNPPGLSSLKYRIGTHRTFKNNMLADIPNQRALSVLTTRDDNDLIISLFDAWATVADVLTFYQERIANEGFLSTATERFSILQLARPVGYELSPGVAAHTYLSFTLDKSPATLEGTTKINRGTRVQSIPNQGEMPQTFETVYDIEANPDWNELSPNLSKPQILDIDEIINDKDPHVYLSKADSQIKPGSKLLIQLPQTDNKKDNKNNNAITKEEESNNDNNNNNVTSFVCATVSRFDKQEKCLYFNILPTISTRKQPNVENILKDNSLNSVQNQKAAAQKEDEEIDQANQLVYEILVNVGHTFGKVPEIEKNKNWHQKDLVAFAAKNHYERKKFFELFNFEAQRIVHETVRKYNNVNNNKSGIYLLTTKASLFGHNAPAYDSLPKLEEQFGPNWDTPPMDIRRSYDRTNKTNTNDTNEKDVKIYLDNIYQSILPNSWIVLHDMQEDIAIPYLISKISERSLADFLLSSKVTEISLGEFEPTERQVVLERKQNNNNTVDYTGTTATTATNFNPPWNSFLDFKLRQTSVYAQSEKLSDLALDKPFSETEKTPIQSNVENKCIILDHVVDGLYIGQPVYISGVIENSSHQNEVAEIAIIDDIDLSADKYHTQLTFKSNLVNKYDKKTIKINANVAYATHGETKEEIIGSGDPSQKHQQFILGEKPLTFISLPTSKGLQSTLEVYVNDIPWREVFSLVNAHADEHVYMVQIDSEGIVHVIFGDSVNGSLLPAGTNNIRAKYRVGIGKEGLVKKNQLKILLDRPLGVKSVINPENTIGAEDPEGVQSASENTSKNTITIGGTLVSISDFESFASSFTGVGKAKAFDIWNGREHVVCITVASSLGQIVERNSDLFKNLKMEIDNNKDPLTTFHLDTFKPKFFSVNASVKIYKNYNNNTNDIKIDKDAGLIKKQIEDILHEKFSFANRDFAQAIKKDEVVDVIQQIEGVNKVIAMSIYESGKDPKIMAPKDKIVSSAVKWNAPVFADGSKSNDTMGFFGQAELLLIHPDSGPKALDITII